MPRDLAAGEEADQGHVAQGMAHGLQFGIGSAEVRAAATGTADVDGAPDPAGGVGG